MPVRRLYHGTNGDNALSILKWRVIRPRNGEIYFGLNRPDRLFMHGGDLRRRASFVLCVDVEIPEPQQASRRHTQGVTDTLVVKTTNPLRATVVELFIRRLEDGTAAVTRVTSPQEMLDVLAL